MVFVNERKIVGYRDELRTRIVPVTFIEDGKQVEDWKEETYYETAPITEIVVRELTEDEYAHCEPVPVPVQSAEERIRALEEMNNMLLECVLEMSEIVYA